MQEPDLDNTRQIAIREKKNTFIDQVARIAPSATPEAVFRKLAHLWNQAVGSAWTVLWLRSSADSGPLWEQVCISPREYEDSPQPRGYCADDGPVTEYAFQKRRPEFVFNQKEWQKSIGNTNYRVCGRKIYESMLSEAFLTVQLADGEEDSAIDAPLHVSGALCCHVEGEQELRRVRDEFSDNDLETMSLLSSARMRDAVERLHFNLLVELNQLASRALTKISKNPREERRVYLNGVATLIQRSTNARAVSFFYRTPLVDEVACIHSTGLIDSTGKEVGTKALLNCKYDMGENRTGIVFQTGIPVILPGTDKSNDLSKFVEVFENGILSEGSAILQPIPRSSTTPPRSKGPKADGVIRCIGRIDRFGKSGLQDFDSLEAQTLAFIASQISPVLDTLAVRIQREDQVSIVKHDLLIPAGMIIDSVDELTAAIGDGKPARALNEYLLPDLAMASGLLGNLINQLDVEPQSFTFQPKKTWLEGHIVARNKSMLEHYAKVTNDVDLRFESFSGIPALWIDPNLFERAFFNLVVNAIKYSKSGTIIKILPSRDSNGFHVDVQNEGLGIEFENKNRIFERYFRATNVKKTSGLGLGLYISRAAIEKTGGQLILKQLADPTVFRITFPRDIEFDLRSSATLRNKRFYVS